MRTGYRFSLLVVGLLASVGLGAVRRVPAEYGSIQAAIQASVDGDTVLVAPGMYYETINFGGKNITVTGTDPNDPKIVGYTILNAEEDGTVVTFENGETHQAVLTGFTITKGFGTVDTTLGTGVRLFWGAGVFCKYASPTITRNIIVNNHGPLDLEGADVSDYNLSYGGGIGCLESEAIVKHNVIRGNSSYVGGALLAYLGDVTVTDNLIYDNSAPVGAGAVMIQGCLINNTFVSNNATSSAGEGGTAGNVYAVFDPELEDCLIWNNIICDTTAGGGIFWEGSGPRAGTIAFNNVWNNFPGNYGAFDGATGQIVYGDSYDKTGQAGNISADPLFLNPWGKDFHLTLDSPCINAGDPDFEVAAGATDVDGDPRVYASRIDIGADEYVGYVKPVAAAGRDQHVLEPDQVVTLDGSDSFFYDPCGVRMFAWSQVAGPNVVLDDPTGERPSFIPASYGEYVFELEVADDQYTGESDRVLVLVAENQVPLADAGVDKIWQSPGQVTLDGTDSYDPDKIDQLTYVWSQIEGPAVMLDDPTSAVPSFQAQGEERYVFELVVNDGFADSVPSRVELVTVGVTLSFRALSVGTTAEDGPHYPDLSGTRLVFANGWGNVYTWEIKCLDVKSGKFETFTAPAGGVNTQPKIDGDFVVWAGGAPNTGAVGPECTSIFVRDLGTDRQQTLRSRSTTSSYSHPAVSGHNVVWVRHVGIDKGDMAQWSNMPYDICGARIGDFGDPTFFIIATDVGRRDPFPYADPMGDYDDVVDICGDVVVWEGDGDIYGADISDLHNIEIFAICTDAARQYDPAVFGHFVVWTDERNDEGDIYGADISDRMGVQDFVVAKTAGAQVQPAINGAHVLYVDGNGTGRIRMACVTRRHGVLNVDLEQEAYIAGLCPVLEGATLVWLNGPYGPVQGFDMQFGYSIAEGPVQNVTTGRVYDYIQHAVAGAEAGDEVVVGPGLYREQINFAGKAVTVRSTDPADPAVVAATVLEGSGNVVTFAEAEGVGSVLDGLSVTGGSSGVFCYGAAPTIRRCTIAGNLGAGVTLENQSDITLAGCKVVDNAGPGLDMWTQRGGRLTRHNLATLRHCVIAGNGAEGVYDGRPTIVNCTIVENRGAGINAGVISASNSILFGNDADGSSVQIITSAGEINFCDMEGGWPGTGNLDADPLFVAAGTWIETGWIAGDYHLRSAGRRWDATGRSWVSDAETSPCIDAGDPDSALLDEPLTVDGQGSNVRINMGAYGGTAEASLAP